jgi:Protein of unknown function (DUF3224)
MRHRWRAIAGGIAVGAAAGLSLAAASQAPASPQTHGPAHGPVRKEAAMTKHASGAFDVKTIPLASELKADSGLGRMSLDKQYHGDLEATAKGEMLYAGGPAKGAGGYVAIEQVSGTLQGRSGTFVLQHSGTMTPAGTHLTITVVPDSGTGQLAGLAGSLTIKIDNGKHSYDLEYSLPDAP